MIKLSDLEYRFPSGFFTGTYGWSYTSISDVDFCLESHKRCEFELFLEENEITDYMKGPYYDSILINGYYISRMCVPLNIIFLPEGEMKCWQFANNLMKQTPVIPDKVMRHAVFEMYRSIAKVVSQYNTLDVDCVNAGKNEDTPF